MGVPFGLDAEMAAAFRLATFAEPLTFRFPGDIQFGTRTVGTYSHVAAKWIQSQIRRSR